MEINASPSKTQHAVQEYFDMYTKRFATVVIAGAVISGLAISVLLVACHILSFPSWQYWVTLIILIALLIILGMWLLWILSKPLHDLLQSVAAIADTTPQTPLSPADQETSMAFQNILQPFYELSVKPTAPAPAEETDDMLVTGLDQTPSGIVILNSKQEVIYNNKNAPIRIDRKGDKLIDVLFPEDDTLIEWLANCRENKVSDEHTWTRIANKPVDKQDRRIYDITASFHRDNPAETVITFFDRSTIYAPEEDDLDFISFAAHELRGPITVIRGYLDVINEEVGPKMESDQQELMQRLIVSANRLSSYINNILNASRYDHRHFKIHISEEHLNSIYDTVRDDMQLRAAAQHRILSIDIPDSLPTVAADKNSIGEVLSNLIDNAIKYSNEGGLVVVQARPISGAVEISIIDRGIGMPANVITNLFHKFYRSHRSRETVAGTGIGLYLSKAIVESHGGTIEVRSTESEGSTFSFTLPIYATVADKVKAGNNSNEKLIVHGGGWIRNHSMYRG